MLARSVGALFNMTRRYASSRAVTEQAGKILRKPAKPAVEAVEVPKKMPKQEVTQARDGWDDNENMYVMGSANERIDRWGNVQPAFNRRY